jgi:hypothetical protein
MKYMVLRVLLKPTEQLLTNVLCSVQEPNVVEGVDDSDGSICRF